jgi:hypothetical protein
MMRLLRCVVGLVFFAASAQAEEAPPQAADILAAAVATAVEYSDARYAFSVDFWSEQNGDELALRLRFDPRKASGEQWSLLDTSTDDLSKDQKKAFKQFQKSENSDDALVYDTLEDGLGGVVLVEETQAVAVFTGPVVSDDLPEDVLEMTITLNKAEGFVSQIDVRSIKPFKPMPVAKIKSMTQSQIYAAPNGDGAALLQTSEGAANGKAMFKSFTTQSRQRYFDIERIDASALPAVDSKK